MDVHVRAEYNARLDLRRMGNVLLLLPPRAAQAAIDRVGRPRRVTRRRRQARARGTTAARGGVVRSDGDGLCAFFPHCSRGAGT